MVMRRWMAYREISGALWCVPADRNAVFDKRLTSPCVTSRLKVHQAETNDGNEMIKALNPQVRHKFGCTEEVMEVDGRTVRHCNWLRFLRASTDVCRVNVLARLIDTKATFQVVRPIEPRQELLAFFSTEPLESTKGKLVPVLQSSFNEPKLNTLTQKLLLEDPHDIAEHLANNNSTHASIKNDFELSKIFHGKSFHNFQMTPPNHTSHWKESLSSSGYASLTDRAEVENNPFKSPNYLQVGVVSTGDFASFQAPFLCFLFIYRC